MSLPVCSPARNSEQRSNRRKGKRSTREKIEKLVAEGTKNYPAYLKLIYTGDSEQSEEEENHSDFKVEVVRAIEDGVESVRERAASEDGVSVPVALQGERILSPESDKLMDSGKEKPPTPTDSGAKDGAKKTTEAIATEEVSAKTGNRRNGVQPDDNQQRDNGQQRSDEENWKLELFQLQDDIVSLKSMLNGKLQIASDLKQKLGITPIVEFKHSFFSFKESSTYLRTNAALKSLGEFASRKMGTFRNSVVFKSVEEKVVKVKSKSMSQIRSRLHRRLSGSRSESNVSDLKSNDQNSNFGEEAIAPDSTTPLPLTH